MRVSSIYLIFTYNFKYSIKNTEIVLIYKRENGVFSYYTLHKTQFYPARVPGVKLLGHASQTRTNSNKSQSSNE